MQHSPITKYRPFALAPALSDRRWPDRVADRAPIWCSVDLRDGNQALASPMGVAEKLEFFQLLVRLGFKEIEIGFPAASDTEFAFCRELIERRLIPADVSVQVLTQCREHLVLRTFEALRGATRPIVHIYNSTSPLQRRVTFGNASRADIKRIAADSAALVKRLAPALPGMRLEYSPESFSDTETEFALEVCEQVMDIWEPTDADPIILNLPETVQWTTPNIYADQIEWFCRQLEAHRRRTAAVVSLHTHNDRGTGTAATELGLLAGADRVEGTLFGNGERTGNLDIVNVALNLYAAGVDPQLALDDLPAVREVYERCVKMPVHPRHPYAGELVFTAFSGSHQDAIKKGMDLRDALPDAERDAAPWAVPYLTIDPRDIGGGYEAIIRVNSQSGKGGVAYILDREFGLDLPKAMHPQVGAVINTLADRARRDLSPAEIHAAFKEHFVNLTAPVAVVSFEHRAVDSAGSQSSCSGGVHAATGASGAASTSSGASAGSAGAAPSLEIRAVARRDGAERVLRGAGNGPLNAFVHALEAAGWKNFTLRDYRSQAVGAGSDATAAAYVCIERDSDHARFWGCGLDSSIETAAVNALVSALNRSITGA